MTELHHKIMDELDKSKDMPLKHLYNAEDEIKKQVERNNRNYVFFPEETMARELPDVKNI